MHPNLLPFNMSPYQIFQGLSASAEDWNRSEVSYVRRERVTKLNLRTYSRYSTQDSHLKMVILYTVPAVHTVDTACYCWEESSHFWKFVTRLNSKLQERHLLYIAFNCQSKKNLVIVCGSSTARKRSKFVHLLKTQVYHQYSIGIHSANYSLIFRKRNRWSPCPSRTNCWGVFF